MAPASPPKTLGKGLLSQFEGINFRQMRFPFVDSPEKAVDCLARIRQAREQDGIRPLVIMTMMNPQISAMLRQGDALFLDLFEVFIAPLEKELGVRSAHTVGRSHGQAGREYTNRIAAMSFAIAHDDGVSDADLENADVILVGVSRCGKTPTSMYLAMQFGLRAANYPLIPEDFERDRLPDTLSPFRDKLFGLTIAPDTIAPDPPGTAAGQQLCRAGYLPQGSCRRRTHDAARGYRMVRRDVTLDRGNRGTNNPGDQQERMSIVSGIAAFSPPGPAAQQGSR